MTIRILPSSDSRYHAILSVKRGKGDAKLIAWLASFAPKFELTGSAGAWLIRVRFLDQAQRQAFDTLFEPHRSLVPA